MVTVSHHGKVTVLMIWCATLAIIEADVVGTIGSADLREDSDMAPAGNNTFYLNTQRPATASGTVSSLRFCPDFDVHPDSTQYQATIGFFRPLPSVLSPSVTNYTLLSSLLVTRSADFGQDSVRCETMNISSVGVEEGDVIGVCGRNFNDSVRRINFVFDSNNTDDVLLRVANAVDIDCASVGSIPSSVVGSLLSDRNQRVLWISGNIESAVNTTMATVEDTTPTPAASTEPQMDNKDLKVIAISAGVAALVLVVCTCSVVLFLLVALRVKRKKDGAAASRVIGLSQSLLAADYFNATPPPLQDTLSAIEFNVLSSLSSSSRQTSSYAIESLHSTSDLLFESHSDENTARLDEFTELDDTRDAHKRLFRNYEVSDVGSNYYDFSVSESSQFLTFLEMNQERDIYSDLNPYSPPASHETALYHQLKAIGIKNIPRSKLGCLGHLGSGRFGTVEKAVWTWGQLKTDVALKSLNSQFVRGLDRVRFLQEAVLVAQFKHPNIISLYGVVSIEESVSVKVILVLAFASRGDLLQVLKSLKPDPREVVDAGLQSTLLIYSQQIALGMQYLSSKHFIHRDLAGRNILVTGENICKIADFGMSRHLEDEDYYTLEGGKVPVKWMAPEALRDRKFSTASDVWSYGCVLYEIWSLGTKPFSDTTNFDVIKLVSDGKRLTSPPGCPKKIYKLMLFCWKQDLSARPRFRSIVNALLQDRIFHIPPLELETHPQAGILGAPLSAGESLYKNLRLQHT